MYPALELLQEVGRVTIAGSRLEVKLGWLWWQLDKDGVSHVDARKSRISRQIASIQQLANERLFGDLQASVQEAAADAKVAAERRNEIVHQDWVLRGPDAMRSVAELNAVLAKGDMDRYIEEWDREAKPSPDWLGLPGRSLDLIPGHALDDLRAVERRLAHATDRVTDLVFAVASARDTGHPAGWVTSPAPNP